MVARAAVGIPATLCRWISEIIASILDNNLDRQPAAPTAEAAPLVHANIRGSRYFH
jgi:hypothetical protein